MKICLDAGHYGKINRSPAVPSYYESEMTWKLHLLLKSELEKRGFSVITTRSTQAQDLELVSRGRKAAGCDLFISLHSNAVGTESVDRPVGIYLIPDSSTNADEKSKAIAALLAKTVRDVMGTTQAEQIMSRAGNDRNGDGKPDDYYGVLYGAHSVSVPGVILEHGFHTNKKSALWLLDESNLKKLAIAEAKALAEYYGVKQETGPGNYPAVPFAVQVIINDLNYRSEPSMSGTVKGQTGKGVFTIVQVSNDWGKLKSGAGWIYLGNSSYCAIKGAAKPTETKKSIEEIAREVIRGKWGVGTDRKNRLTSAGYDYSAVQRKVNELLR